MKQEFITVRGKAIIEQNILFIRMLDFKIANTIFFELGFPLLILTIFILMIASNTDGKENYLIVIFWGLFALSQLPRLFDLLFKRSYSNRIPLDRIKSYELKKDPSGLETNVILKLSSGRYRCLRFRNLENQFERFVAILSEYIPRTQLA